MSKKNKKSTTEKVNKQPLDKQQKETKPSLAQEVAEEIALRRLRGEKVDTYPEILLDI